MNAATASLPYWIAAILATGSLVFYFVSAFLWRIASPGSLDARTEFNLAIPVGQDTSRLFAIALVSAGTSLSTVFLFFLTSAFHYGWWLLVCPVAFAMGNALAFRVYSLVKARAYFESGDAPSQRLTGLLPFLATKLTGSGSIGWIVMVLSGINLLAILTLELAVGADVADFLSRSIRGSEVGGLSELLFVGLALALLLGYVFVGGFRAVIASDIWQMKSMRWALWLSALLFAKSLLEKGALGNLTSIRWGDDAASLTPFLINVLMANLLIPLSQESSWQRFRAFDATKSFSLSLALKSSIRSSLSLWFVLIGTSFLLLANIAGTAVHTPTSMPEVFEAVIGLGGSELALVVFPVLVVACLAAMFSTADTAVSGLLYLIEFWLARSGRSEGSGRLPNPYYLAMIVLYVCSLGMFLAFRVLLHPTVQQLVFSVFSNLVVLAPTVLFLCLLEESRTEAERRSRTLAVAWSLGLGFAVFWTLTLFSFMGGAQYLWLSQLSIAGGFLAAATPVLLVLVRLRSLSAGGRLEGGDRA